MKIRTFTLLFLSVFAVSLMAQPEASIAKTDEPPVIDGIIDDMWADVEAYDIDQIYVGDNYEPTLGMAGETYWKMVWDDAGIYVLLNVTDDDFFPNWADDPVGANSWQYDKPEIYFDVNYILADGGGTQNGENHGLGHYQFAPDITEDNMNGLLETYNDAVEYCNLVTDPNYVTEFFIPMDYMQNDEGGPMDPTAEIGFDVYIMDRDQTREMDDRSRAVWANVGNVDQAWGNMDDCGIITFDGAEPPTLAESVTLTGGTIDANNGTLQIGIEITPEDVSSTALSWSIVGLERGGAMPVKISSDGMVTGVMDGTYTIQGSTTDGSYIDATCEVEVRGQIISRSEINLIRNGYFQDVDASGNPAEWNISGMTNSIVEEGVLYVSPTDGVDIWSNRVQQTQGWNLSNDPTNTYTLSFGLWTDESDTINVDFEDAREAVGWNRYGTSAHELSNGGILEWQWMSETEKSAASKYVFDCTFEELIYDESIEQFQFMLGHADGVVMIDSVELFLDADLEKITEGVVEVETITVTGADGATSVHAGATLQMAAEVLPADANYTDVRWMVEPGTGDATIDEAGLLTGDTAGTVTVKAMAMDDSKVYGMLEVTVLFPASIENKFVNTLKVYPNPAVNELYVELAVPNSIVTVYNSVGAKMDEVLVSGTQHRLDISHYGSGIYFVKTGELVAKFIK